MRADLNLFATSGVCTCHTRGCASVGSGSLQTQVRLPAFLRGCMKALPDPSSAYRFSPDVSSSQLLCNFYGKKSLQMIWKLVLNFAIVERKIQ